MLYQQIGKLGCFGLIGLLAVGASAPGQTRPATRTGADIIPPAEIDAVVARVLKSTDVSSASVATIQGGKIVFTKAYGAARREPLLTARPEMRYSIGSISKQFAATVILLLVQDGKLSLDDPVGKYLPGLTRANEVTIRQVLSMTSGYQDYWPEDYVMTSLMKPTTPDQILDNWGHKPLDFEPGTQWQYSNTNYVIAGRIAEIGGGKPLIDQIRERIFNPLKMTDVLDSDSAPLPAGEPTGYFRHGLAPPRPAPQCGTGWMFAAGELAMSAGDLAIWNLSLMNRSLLKQSSYEQMFTAVKLKDGKSTGYGLGISVFSMAGHRFLEHSGEVSGFESENIVFPDDRSAITVLTNEDNTVAASGIAWSLAAKLLKLPGPSSAPSPAKNAAAQAVETPAVKAAHLFFTQLQQGKVDRTQLTPFCNAYFSDEAISDFASSLKPLGMPDGFVQIASESRGGLAYEGFRVKCGNRNLQISIFKEPDGKLEQYMVSPAAR